MIISKTPKQTWKKVYSAYRALKNTNSSVEMVVCRHSRYRDRAWQSIGGGNKPAPSLPFLAVRLLISEQEMLQLGLQINDILMLGSFEQSIAWAWLASKESDNE